MRIIFFGTPDFAVPSLKALLAAGEEIVLVVTQPDRLKGRGHKPSRPAVKEFALSNGIAVKQPDAIRSPVFLEEIAEKKPDVIVVVAYGRILPPPLLRLPRLGCVNVHASLLPRYRGAAPIQWAIRQGDLRTGVTTMLMDEGLDTGDIFLQEEVVIGEEDNGLTLGLRLAEVGASLLLRTLGRMKDGSIQATPQTGVPSYAPPLKKEDGRVDWSLPASSISDLVRGTFPWPAAYCYLNKERITIIRARAEAGAEGAAGRVEKISDEGFYVGTGKGLLLILEVKPEGKNVMSAADFMRGRRLTRGAFFGAS